MMMATGARQMKIVAVGLVRFELSLHTLLMVIEKIIFTQKKKFFPISLFLQKLR